MRAQSLFASRPSGLFGNRVSRMVPGQGTSIHTLGWTLTTSGAVSNALTGVARRTSFAFVGQTRGFHTASPQCWLGDTSGFGGFSLSIRFALAGGNPNPASTRAFVGLSASTSPVVDVGNPSGVANSIGVGFDSGDSTGGTWFVIRRDGTNGNKTAVTGASRDTSLLDLAIVSRPYDASGRAILMRLTNLDTGAILLRDELYVAEVGSYLPAADALLLVHAAVRSADEDLVFDVAQAAIEVPDGARVTPRLLGRAGHYDIRDFGARGDGTNADDAAFALAMSAMGPVNNFDPTERQGTLYVPPGAFKVTSPVDIERALRLHGAGPAGRTASEGPSKLVFEPRCGVRTFTAQCSPNEGDATYAIIEDLEIEGNDDGELPSEWSSGNYSSGDRLRPKDSRGTGRGWDFYVEQVLPGGPHASGAIEPDFSSLSANDPSSTWAPTTAYRVNTAVRATSRYDGFFRCIDASDESGAAEPGWSFTPGGTTRDPALIGPFKWKTVNGAGYFVADGGTLASPGGKPIWACRVSSGIYAQAVITIRRVGVRGYLNAGLTIAGALLTDDNAIIQGSNTSFSSINDVFVSDCGLGIFVLGRDANQCVFTCAHVRPRADGDSGKVSGIHDSSNGGSRFFSCRVESADGPAFLSLQTGSSGSAYGCSAVDSDASLFASPQGYGFFGNSFEAGIEPVDAGVLLGAIAPEDWQALDVAFAPEAAEARVAQYWGGDSLALFAVLPNVDEYRLTRSQGFAPGWYHLLGTGGGFPIAYSTENAVSFDDRGPGYVWTPTGILVGSTRSIITTADAKPVDGVWRRGDIVFNAMPALDAPSYWQCVDDDPLEFRDGPILGIALNGWWRADYPALMDWKGSPSGGGSGANDLEAGGDPPGGGTPQSGFIPAQFDGNDDVLASTAYIENLIGLSAYTAIVLFYADSADAAATNVEDDPALLTDTWPGWVVAFSDAGFGIAHYDGSWQRHRVDCSVGEYHIGQIRYDGTDLSIRVDSKAWAAFPAGDLTHTASSYVLNVGKGYAGAAFEGRILEIMLAPAAFSDARMDSIVDYLRARYALGVGLALNGWWRADYAGSPWDGTASPGPSGARALFSGTAPGTGTPQGGYVPAAFDGNDDTLESAVYIEDYVSESAYSIVVLFAADAAEPAEPDQQDDPALFTDTMPGVAVTFSDAGFGVAHYDDGAAAWKTLITPCGTATYHIGQVVYDGATLKMRIDSDAWLPLAGVGNLSYTPATETPLIGASDAGNYFEGRILEMMVAGTALTDAQFDNIVAYLNSRYALGLNLALSGWWRADYPGPTTWDGTISGGPSGVRPLGDTSNAPATGTAVNGLVPANFNGSTNTLSSPVFIEEYLSAAAYSVVILFNADTASVAAGNIEDDPAIITDSWPGWAITFSDGGVGVAHFDGSWKGDRVACATGGWHAAQIVYDGTELRMQIDSGGWNVLANPVGNLQHAAASYYLIAGKSYVPGYFDGRVLEIMMAPEAFTEPKFDAILDYLNGRYALAL